MAIEIDLSAAVVALDGETPLIAVVRGDEAGLPYGAFEPTRHRTLEIALRAWTREQAALTPAYTEQLYTFADQGRHARADDASPHTVSIGYLVLSRPPIESEASPVAWSDWYGFFPWEDRRGGEPAIVRERLRPAVEAWTRAGDRARELRVRTAFGDGETPWDEERALERYELLYEAGLVAEARRDGREVADPLPLGRMMRHDHRRILATAISRLRGKLKYRPVIFELMPRAFTLTQLQVAAEAIAGRTLHKQNFRRLVESARLVEPTGAKSAPGQGRPAALFRFRRDALRERPSLGLRLGSR